MSKYFLHIDSPCSQSWEGMSPDENGRFCSNCNKSVFDFTTASDGEIARYMDKHKDEELICGRFRESQLDRWLEESNLKKHYPSIYKFLMGFILLTAGRQAAAQKPARQEVIMPKINKDSLTSLNVEYTPKECPVKIQNSDSTVFDCAKIRIGGVRTLTGDNYPLLIIDGKPAPLETLINISPEMIKTQSIMKGATAAAVYGTEAANGVIIIETKYSKKERKKLF